MSTYPGRVGTKKRTSRTTASSSCMPPHRRVKSFCENARHIIGRAGVIVSARIAHRQECRVPSSRVVDQGNDKEEEEHNANQSVRDRVPAPSSADLLSPRASSKSEIEVYHGGMRGEPRNR